MQERAEVVAVGAWLYDRTVSMPVLIVRLDYDFWYRLGEANGDLEADEEPTRDPDGVTYYVSFHGVPTDGSFWPDSLGHTSVEAAKAAAQAIVPSEIRW